MEDIDVNKARRCHMELKEIAEINVRNLKVLRRDILLALTGSIVINLAIHWIFL